MLLYFDHTLSNLVQHLKCYLRCLAIIDMQLSESPEGLVGESKAFLFQLTTYQYQCAQEKLPLSVALVEVKKEKKNKKKPTQDESSTKNIPKSSKSIQQEDLEETEKMNAYFKKKRKAKKAMMEDYVVQQTPRRKPMEHPYTSRDYGQGALTEEELSICQFIITELKQNPNSKPFLKPVNPVELQIPDYFDIVHHPMDLSTLEQKIKYRTYITTKQFKQDLTLIWMNSYKYNRKGTQIYSMTAEMDKHAAQLLSKLPMPTGNPYSTKLVAYNSYLAPKKQYVSNPKSQSKDCNPTEFLYKMPGMRQMTVVEKEKLSQDLRSLREDQVPGALAIIGSSELSIKNVYGDTLWKLHSYISENQKQKHKKLVEKSPDSFQSGHSSSFLLDPESN